MKHEVDEYVLDIARKVSAALNGCLDVSTTRWIAPQEAAGRATLAFLVDAEREADSIVLLISNPRWPDVVADAVARARTVTRLVDEGVGRHIVKPIQEGCHGGQSYAAYARLHPLSGNRWVGFPQKLRTAPRIVAWAAALALQTRQDRTSAQDRQTYFAAPLEALCKADDLPAGLRAVAAEALKDIPTLSRGLFTVAEHGDFWIGNILFQRGGLSGVTVFPQGFGVIDWGGAIEDGYPCADLLRFCASIYRQGSGRSDALVQQYAQALKMERRDMGLYAAASLGRMGQNLGTFPRENYRHICQSTFQFMQSHGLLPDGS